MLNKVRKWFTRERIVFLDTPELKLVRQLIAMKMGIAEMCRDHDLIVETRWDFDSGKVAAYKEIFGYLSDPRAFKAELERLKIVGGSG